MPQPKILMVDDSPNILKALRRTFELENYTIICAASAAEALAVLAEQTIDVIISDEHMVGMSGTELLMQVKEAFPNVARMMLTGSSDIEVAKGAINGGHICRFFTKPWEDWELLIGVRQTLRVAELERENGQLKSSLADRDRLLQDLENRYPGIAEKRQTEDGSFIID